MPEFDLFFLPTFLISAFGFCEYEQPEATLRCIRLLNEWQIADKKLVVRIQGYALHYCSILLLLWLSYIGQFILLMHFYFNFLKDIFVVL